MLKRLSISNYALIDKTEILPGHGLSIITGETGSGKSIMLDALGLVAGQRADVSALQDKFKKCVIEAEFETVENWFKDFFSENDLDYSEVSIFRREINPNVVRASGYQPKSDWWIWYNTTVHCVKKLTGCDLGDVTCAERHAFQRLIRGPFKSILTAQEGLLV